MLRPLLFGVLAFSTASACKGSADAPAVKAGATAGKVVELAGTVSATRSDAKRPLAAGQEISGDDVIETSADSHVRILLAHNNAVWELGPNRKEAVGASLAWTLPKQDGPAATVNEATLAAGRHAERETVTTANTAPAPGGAVPPVAEPPPPPTTTPAADTPPPPPPAPPQGGERAPVEPADKGGVRGGPSQRPRAITALPPPAQTEEKSAKPTDVDGGSDKKVTAKRMAKESVAENSRADSAGAPTAPTTAARPIDPSLEVKQAVDAKRAALVACMEQGARIELSLVVAKGKGAFVYPAGTSDKAKACFSAVAAKLTFPASYELRIDVPLTK